jgi:hypothetical protein
VPVAAAPPRPVAPAAVLRADEDAGRQTHEPAPATVHPLVTGREPGSVTGEPPAGPPGIVAPDRRTVDERAPPPPAAAGPGTPAPAGVPIPPPRPHHEGGGRVRSVRRWLRRGPRRRGQAQEAPPPARLPFPFGLPFGDPPHSQRGRQGRGAPETAPLPGIFWPFDEAPPAREPARGRQRRRSDSGEGEEQDA